ncbi:MAG: hypothetical protein GY753_11945 [Gammaproteobacteria bacterium]|nr:hypothetical protein [Gammaproteobacteria bacterium]
MGGGKSTPTPPAPPEAEELPTPESSQEPVAKAIRDEEARKLRERRGAAGTILTSPLGTNPRDDDNLLGN